MTYFLDDGCGGVTLVEFGEGCKLCEFTPGAYYEHAPDCEEGNLCSGMGAHEFDCNGEWVPCPGCSVVEVIR